MRRNQKRLTLDFHRENVGLVNSKKKVEMKKNRKYLFYIVILGIVIKLGMIFVNNRIYRDAFLYINMAKKDNLQEIAAKGWITYRQELNSYSGIATKKFYSGKHSLKIVNNDKANAGWYYNRIYLKEKVEVENLTISAVCKSKNAMVKPRIHLIIEFTDKTQTSINLWFKNKTHDWEFKSKIYSFDKKINAIRPYCLLYGNTGTAWFDDIKITSNNNKINLVENGDIENTVSLTGALLYSKVPPFYILLLTFGEYIAIGAANFAYLLAIVLGIFTTIAIYAITKHLFMKEKLALIASFLFAIHPFFLRADLGVIRDSLYIPVLIYCIYFAMNAIVNQKDRSDLKSKTIIYWILFAVCAAIANATRREGIELIVIFTIWIFVEMFFIRKEYIKSILSKTTIFFTVFLIWSGISYSFYYFSSNYTLYNWNIIDERVYAFLDRFIHDDVKRLKKWEK